MTGTVEIPIWLLVLVLAFAFIAALDRVLVPSARWYLRRRMERVVARLNKRLERPIQPFKLMTRQDMIMRLVHDPAVSAAVADHAHEEGGREDVAFERARAYAREIVPSFSATVYFGFATRFARRLSQSFYKVQISPHAPGREVIDTNATVIFVMNHRSNMDYVLVTWLVANRSALSYAVGEWARVWPLSRLIRSMGAYFIRRNSRNQLYRRVLARYVQMSAQAGVTQAFFPEGGLSLDGRIHPPRVGLLSYIVSDFEAIGRDVVFVPVAIAYDRVLEDRVLVDAAAAGERKFRAGPLSIAGFVLRMGWRLVRGRFPGFGSAAVAFGGPVSLRAWIAENGPRPEALANRLMADVGRVVPILPVPLVAAVASQGVARADMLAAMQEMATRLEAAGAPLFLPEGGVPAALAEGLRALEKRGILEEGPTGMRAVAGKETLLAFYAAAVLQRLSAT